MAKRKVDDERLRSIVRARMTKGDAFSDKTGEYQTNQQVVANHLADLTRAEIFKRYSEYTYDLKV